MRRDEGTDPEDEGTADVPSGDSRDFEAFLGAIGYGHYYRNVLDGEPARARAGPYPDTIPAGPQPHRSGHATVVVALALLWVAAWPVAYNALHRAVAPQAAGASAACVSFPVLGLGAIQSVRPGLTAAEVRDLVGLPQFRMADTGPASCELWVYPAPLDSPHMPETGYAVRVRNGRVVSVGRVVDVQNTFEGAEWLDCQARHVGDVNLPLDGGRIQHLRAREERPAVLIGPLCPPGLDALPLPDGRLFRWPAPAANGSDAEDDVAGISRAFPLSIYYRGFLLHVPPTSVGVSNETVRGDVEWLLGRLGHP